MTFDLIKFINISVETSGILLCILGVIVVLVGTKIEKNTAKYFVAIFICLAVDLLSNMAGQLTKGMTDTFGYYAVRIANFCEFSSSYILTFIFTMYLLYCVDSEKKHTGLRKGVVIYYSAQILLLILSQFTDMYYYFDESNVYHRGGFFWLSHAVSIGSMLLNAVILIKNRRKLSSKELIAFACYIIIPGIAIIISMFSYGLYVVLFSCIISAALMFIFMLSAQVDKYCEKERENTDMQVALMLSQIQPHFLYNALDSIYHLCGKDSARAQTAISKFADYLRVNLNSLKQKTPVPFDTELEHIKTYLSLEKMSSGDELNFDFDIQTTAFSLPALSVQPLVENSVKHGINKKAGGGMVRVVTREYSDKYEIKVIDDGIGFDTSKPHDDEKIHIGIENVRDRLSAMCGGTLELSSTPGEGTVAVISLPKGE